MLAAVEVYFEFTTGSHNGGKLSYANFLLFDRDSDTSAHRYVWENLPYLFHSSAYLE